MQKSSRAGIEKNARDVIGWKKTKKEVRKMKKYLLIVRCQILMGRPVTDYDRKALDCYHEIQFFCNAQNWEDVEMVDAAYEQFCVGRPEFRHTESAELVCIE